MLAEGLMATGATLILWGGWDLSVWYVWTMVAAQGYEIALGGTAVA